MLDTQIIELIPATIGENHNGVYVADCNYACSLLSTMNLIKEQGLMNSQLEVDMIRNFDQMIQEEPDLDFVQSFRIPQSVERLTNGLFYARLSAIGSTNFLRTNGVRNAEKYSLETSTVSPPTLYCVLRSFRGKDFYHLMAIPEVNKNGFLVIDDGERKNEIVLPRGTAYKLEKS